jgi:cell division protein FtsQ
MNPRAHLAHSSLPKAGRRDVPRMALPEQAWRRTAARWCEALIEHAPPRGIGTAAAALLMLGSLAYGVVRGGHAPELAGQVQAVLDDAANGLGFGITEIAVVGNHDLRRGAVLQTAGITGRSSLLFLDAGQARARLLINPWVAEATVLKFYPGRLRIEIKEREPFALWQKDGVVALIAADGTVLEHHAPSRYFGLPLLVGTGAQHAGEDFLALLRHYPAIAQAVEAAVFVAQRRWNLHLKNGVEVLLPAADPAKALELLVALDRTKKLLSRDIVAVDLRLADRVTVRLSEAAAAARSKAIEAAEKARKKKRKAGEA